MTSLYEGEHDFDCQLLAIITEGLFRYRISHDVVGNGREWAIAVSCELATLLAARSDSEVESILDGMRASAASVRAVLPVAVLKPAHAPPKGLQ